MARILVSLNPNEGLADAMTMKYRDLEFLQMLDYENLPFRCNICHKYGHLVKECTLGHQRRRRQKKTYKQEDVSLSVEEVQNQDFRQIFWKARRSWCKLKQRGLSLHPHHLMI